MQKKIFYYRGMIECFPYFTWREGYSEKGPRGGVLYPWKTKAECILQAIDEGCKAVFYRDGKKENF